MLSSLESRVTVTFHIANGTVKAENVLILLIHISLMILRLFAPSCFRDATLQLELSSYKLMI